MVMSEKRTLIKTTVNLTPRTEASLILAAQATGDSKTDTINRAIQVYGFLVTLREQGKTIYAENPDGTRNELTAVI